MVEPQLPPVDRPDLRLVSCELHGGNRRCYIVCSHIKTAADVEVFEHAEQDFIGTISCQVCAAKSWRHDDDYPDLIDSVRIMCEECVVGFGIIADRRKVN